MSVLLIQSTMALTLKHRPKGSQEAALSTMAFSPGGAILLQNVVKI